eukprot:12939954-Alexandrium_andersonii.AAC.1
MARLTRTPRRRGTAAERAAAVGSSAPQWGRQGGTHISDYHRRLRERATGRHRTVCTQRRLARAAQWDHMFNVTSSQRDTGRH